MKFSQRSLNDVLFLVGFLVNLCVSVFSLQSVIVATHIQNIFYLGSISFAVFLSFLYIRKNHITRNFNDIVLGTYLEKNYKHIDFEFFTGLIGLFFIILLGIVTFHLFVRDVISLISFLFMLAALFAIFLFIMDVFKNKYIIPSIFYIGYELTIIFIYSLFISTVLLSTVNLVYIDSQKIQELYSTVFETVGEIMYDNLLAIIFVFVPFCIFFAVFLPLIGKQIKRTKKRDVIILLAIGIFMWFMYSASENAQILVYLFKAIFSKDFFLMLLFPQNIVIYQIFYLMYPVVRDIVGKFKY